jgi:hypothetical protein
VKGKPWPNEDEKKLRTWVEMGIGIETIVFSFKGKYTKDASVQKMFDLKLKMSREEKIEISRKKTIFSSSKLDLPADLPTVEEALQILAGARAILLNQVSSNLDKLRKDALVVEKASLSKVEELATDPLEFFRLVPGVEPRDYQKELIELFAKNQFVAAC